jgi:hypothetical protein
VNTSRLQLSGKSREVVKRLQSVELVVADDPFARRRLSNIVRDKTPRRFKALAANITTYPAFRIRP